MLGNNSQVTEIQATMQKLSKDHHHDQFCLLIDSQLFGYFETYQKLNNISSIKDQL